MIRKFMHEIVEYVLENPTDLKKDLGTWELYKDHKIIAAVRDGLFGMSSVIKFDKAVGVVKMTSQEKEAFKKLTIEYVRNISLKGIVGSDNTWLRSFNGGFVSTGGYKPDLEPTIAIVNNEGPGVLDIAVGVAAGVVVGDIIGNWMDDI